MTFQQPLFLLVCLGAVLPLAARSGRTLAISGLPAGWSWLIAAEMRTIAMRHVIPSRDTPGVLLAAALWLVLGVALAEPVLREGNGGVAVNLAGRVLVLDMSNPERADSVRAAAADVATSLPEVPVALVAATGDAFDVVPFTTDRQHIRRYLAVLSPDLMPVGGHEPQRAIAHAEAMLVRAGMIAGQTVLITGSGTAPGGQLARDRWLKAVVVAGQGTEASPALMALAEQADATLVHTPEIGDLDRELIRATSSLIEDSPEISGNVPLQHWLIGLACILWLFQFRRPS